MPFTIRIEAPKNRLYVTLSGLMADEEARAAADACIDAFQKLKPGFVVINDISQFRPLTKEGVLHVKRAGEAGMKLGMAATVRIVGISPTAAQQFQRAAKEGSYTAYTVHSLAEAEKLLDEEHR